MAYVSQGPVRLTLTDEPCRLAAVVDLPYRATWVEGSHAVEGCYGVHPDYPLVVAYFTDRSITVIPRQAFTVLTGV